MASQPVTLLLRTGRGRSLLTTQQLHAIEVLAHGGSVRDAARVAGASGKTVGKWLKSPQFFFALKRRTEQLKWKIQKEMDAQATSVVGEIKRMMDSASRKEKIELAKWFIETAMKGEARGDPTFTERANDGLKDSISRMGAKRADG